FLVFSNDIGRLPDFFMPKSKTFQPNLLFPMKSARAARLASRQGLVRGGKHAIMTVLPQPSFRPTP
ncbi:hypothetical protein ABH309_03745, partial [Chromobacterium piscinae]